MTFDESNLQVLVEFSVPVDLNAFITQFWSDSQFFAEFLEHRLEDLKVHVGEWEEGKHFLAYIASLSSLYLAYEELIGYTCIYFLRQPSSHIMHFMPHDII